MAKDTEIVIEGFPRSANTFAVLAFQYAQQRDVKIAHHIHSQAQIIKGVALNIPVCVLIRNPIDAVKSLMIAFPYISFKIAIKAYIKFYADIYELRNYYVIATFEEVTKNFSTIIEEINEKFSKDFRIKDFQKIREEIFESMLKSSNELRTLWIPTSDRNKLKSEFKIKMTSQEEKLLSQAQEIYEKYLRFNELNR